MKKRCFARYDAHIDATYRIENSDPEWKSCLITKISRKGIGAIFPEHAIPLPGAMLTIVVSTAHRSESIRLLGTVKWVQTIDGRHAGGIELSRIVDEAQWLQLIYFIREPGVENKIVDLRAMPEHKLLKKSVHPPPAKVIVPSTMDYIKNILNYKIL